MAAQKQIIEELNFSGNIIYLEWFDKLKSTFHADINLIMIISELIYRYKFSKNQRLQISYKEIGHKLNLSSAQIKYAFSKLQDQQYINKIMDTSKHKNELYVIINLQKLEDILGADFLYRSGHVVPATWLKHITFDTGRPNYLACMLLAEIVYWNRPGKHIQGEFGKKNQFGWQTNYGYLSDRFHYSTNRIRLALKCLEDLGLIKRNWPVMEVKGIRNTTLCLDLNIDNLAQITPNMVVAKKEPVKKKIEHNIPEKKESKNDEGGIMESKGGHRHSTVYKEKEYAKNINLDKQNLNLKIHDLKSYLPLSFHETALITANANREFSHEAVNKLALHLANKYPHHIFVNRSILLNYLTKAVECEIRTAPKINSSHFRFPLQNKEENEMRERENTLAAIEYSKQLTLDIKAKKRIIASFDPDEAYFLIKYCYFKEYTGGDSYVIDLYKPISREYSLMQLMEELLPDKIKITFRLRDRMDTKNIVALPLKKYLYEYFPLDATDLQKIFAATKIDFKRYNKDIWNWIDEDKIFMSKNAAIEYIIQAMNDRIAEYGPDLFWNKAQLENYLDNIEGELGAKIRGLYETVRINKAKGE